MAHGYMREFDEGRDRDEERSRDWRRRDENGGDWRSNPSGSQDRHSDGFMLGADQDHYRPPERQRWRQGSAWENNGDWPHSSSRQSRFGIEAGGGLRGDHGERHSPAVGARDDRRESFRSHPDDHYRSWRQQQIDALDRDYADYCREREQQFHHEFDSWRQNRQANRLSEAGAAEGELELTQERALAGQGNTPSPMSEATLGTNNSENTYTGRKQR